MKKNNKKPAIKDKYGRRVVIETIAAYQPDAKGMKVHLRSGQVINMGWEYNSGAVKAADAVDQYFDFVNED